ncbi:MAG: hypothetical protein ACO1RT_19395 [Planctomycetaceae bacterium]
MIGRVISQDGRSPDRLLQRLAFMSSAVVWLTVIIGCVYWLFDHSYRPAQIGEVVAEWPRESSLNQGASGFRLVMFAHPCCPCTAASLSELDELLRRAPKGTTAIVAFTTQGLSQEDLSLGENLRIARSLKNVSIHMDDGTEAEAFGASVSGEVLAFDELGRRVFRGGLTSARGHRGESPARSLLQQLLCGQIHTACETPVFGCRLP